VINLYCLVILLYILSTNIRSGSFDGISLCFHLIYFIIFFLRPYNDLELNETKPRRKGRYNTVIDFFLFSFVLSYEFFFKDNPGIGRNTRPQVFSQHISCFILHCALVVASKRLKKKKITSIIPFPLDIYIVFSFPEC